MEIRKVKPYLPWKLLSHIVTPGNPCHVTGPEGYISGYFIQFRPLLKLKSKEATRQSCTVPSFARKRLLTIYKQLLELT